MLPDEVVTYFKGSKMNTIMAFGFGMLKLQGISDSEKKESNPLSIDDAA